MSEYVEARHVKLALEEARSAGPNVAAKLERSPRADLEIDTIARAKPCSPINPCRRVERRKRSH